MKHTPTGTKNKSLAWQLFHDHFIWILLAGTMIGATWANTRFVSASNLSNILLAAAPLGCRVLAESIVLLTGNFDLSIEANMVFVAIVGGLLMVPPETIEDQLAATQWGLPWHWTIVLAIMLLLASFIGLMNGILVAWLRMNNFMVTMATMIMLEGLALVVGEARNIFVIPAGFRYVGTANIHILADFFRSPFRSPQSFSLDCSQSSILYLRELFLAASSMPWVVIVRPHEQQESLTDLLSFGRMCFVGCFAELRHSY